MVVKINIKTLTYIIHKNIFTKQALHFANMGSFVARRKWQTKME